MVKLFKKVYLDTNQENLNVKEFNIAVRSNSHTLKYRKMVSEYTCTMCNIAVLQ